VDLLGADIQGADFSQVIDFGGTCVVVGKSTVYSTSTQGLTAEMQDRMSLVPEPTSGLLFTAGGLMLIGLSRRRTRGAGRA
jgi:hypothetical protein